MTNSWFSSIYAKAWSNQSSPSVNAALFATIPSVVKSALWFSLTLLRKSWFVEKNQAAFIAAKLNVLLAALKVRLLSTISLSGKLAKGVYRWPFMTKSQCISSANTMVRCFKQISPIRNNSSSVQTFPVGFWGLHRR